MAKMQQDAYPGAFGQTAKDREQIIERMTKRLDDSRVGYYGLKRDDQLVGCMSLHDFKMNLRGQMLKAGGVGAVAVDLAHKKEKIAAEMMTEYLKRYRQTGYPMAVLWPFRPDFYRKMGFGYAGSVYRYRVQPESLPKSDLRQLVRMLTSDDLPSVVACYNRYVSRTNAMIEESEVGLRSLFSKEGGTRVYGFERDSQLEGYIAFRFTDKSQDSFILYDLQVDHLMHDNPDALAGMIGFLQSQLDQVRYVKFDLPDNSLHFFTNDPRDGSDRITRPVNHQVGHMAVGFMCRTINIPATLEALSDSSFGAIDMKVKFEVSDSFMPENSGNYGIESANGRLQTTDPGACDLTVSLDVAELSSLLVGAARPKDLYKYGLIQLSDPGHLASLDTLFATDHEPHCLTPF